MKLPVEQQSRVSAGSDTLKQPRMEPEIPLFLPLHASGRHMHITLPSSKLT